MEVPLHEGQEHGCRGQAGPGVGRGRLPEDAPLRKDLWSPAEVICATNNDICNGKQITETAIVMILCPATIAILSQQPETDIGAYRSNESPLEFIGTEESIRLFDGIIAAPHIRLR